MKMNMPAAEKPLEGKRIAITRAPEQSAELVSRLEQMGAEVVSLPAIAFAPPEDSRPLDSALRHLEDFGAILFLSRNAVRYVLQRCSELGIAAKMLASSNRLIAAVGPATAQEAARDSLRVDYVAHGRTGESLVRELRESLASRNVLLPRSDRGDARVPAALREIGARVTEVISYRNVMPENPDPEVIAGIRRGDVDAIVFASPSAFHNLSRWMGDDASMKELSERIRFAAIGPTTARAVREGGCRAEIEIFDAAAIGIGGIAEEIGNYFQKRPVDASRRSA